MRAVEKTWRRLALLPLALAACSGGALVGRANPPQTPYSIALQSEDLGGLLLVPAVVNGRPATFLFDTGAGTTVLDRAAFERLGLRPRGRVSTRDASARTDRLTATLIRELSLGQSTFRNVGAIVSDLSFVEHHLCRPVDGILGANVMQHGVLQIDYGSGTIQIASKAASLPTPPGRSLVAQLLPTPLPVIPVQAAGTRFGLIVDSGSNGDLAIDRAVVDALAVDPRVPAIGTTSAGLLGLGGHDEAFAWPAVRIGELDLEGADASTAPVATLGNKILRSFTVRIDPARHVATFWPNDRPIPKGHVTFGFGWDYDARGEARVVYVREGSSAFAAGIKEGARVERIGDTTIAGLAPEQLCRLRRDWSSGADAIEVVIAGKTHCLRRRSLFEPPEDAATDAACD